MPSIEPIPLSFRDADPIRLTYLPGQIEECEDYCERACPFSSCTYDLSIHGYLEVRLKADI